MSVASARRIPCQAAAVAAPTSSGIGGDDAALSPSAVPIPARLWWRRRGASRRCSTIEALARLECGVLQLDIAPITCCIVAQEFIGARDDRAVLVQARRLRHRCGPVV